MVGHEEGAYQQSKGNEKRGKERLKTLVRFSQ